MSVILKSPTGEDVQINWWNWRPTMVLVREILELDDRRFEMLQLNGVGATVSPVETQKIADYLDKYLSDFPRDGRLLLDGGVTQTAKTDELYEGAMEQHYSATYAWLVQFKDFCRSSGGFTVL